MDKITTGANGDPTVAGRTRVDMGDQVKSGILQGRSSAGEGANLSPSEAIRRLAYMGLNSSLAGADSAEIDRIARRYRREAQLALEGAVWWAVSWPFELMGALVSAGRKCVDDFFQPTSRRRVPMEE
jgi:hypothetical protein